MQRTTATVKIVHQVLDGRVSGGQLVALELALASRRAGHEVAFVAPSDGEFLEDVRARGMTAAVIPHRRSYRVDDAARLASWLRHERASLLHTHGQLVTNVIGRIGGRLAGVPVVSHMHALTHFRDDRASRLQRALDNLTARSCARILVVSNATRTELVERGYPDARMEVVPNGVAAGPHDGTPVRRELGVDDAATLVVTVGRLSALKGQRELIEAAATLDGVHVLVVGDDVEGGGAMRTTLEQLIDERGLAGRVRLLGYRPDARIVIAAADIFALPSYSEGQPLVVLEAMAEGKPVVATRVGGIPELVVDGETGLLVAPRDVAALATALHTLTTDASLAAKLGSAGRERALRDFSVDAMTARVLEVYGEVLGRG